MNAFLFFSFLVLIFLGFTAGTFGSEGAGNPSPGEEGVTEGNKAFALGLYGWLAGREGNLFFSPHSISTALAMTYGGARGETEKQMARVLHFPADQQSLHAAFSALNGRLNAIENEGHVKLSVANSLWIDKEFDILKEYLELTGTYYQAALHAVDFRRAFEAVRKRINAWIEEQTHDKIKNMIPPGLLDASTRIVLANAIYFKGDWACPFVKHRTKEAPFHTASGQSAEIPMMEGTEKFRYGETASLQLLEMPYAGEDLSMLVLLPKTRDGLAALEKDLTPSNLTAWTEPLVKKKVQVIFPRFRMTSQFKLNDALSAMGMPDAFGGGADFSGMSPGEQIFISAVIHKAFVEVNEEGTEAAAATAVVMPASARPEPPPVFRADHPFIFMIRENASGSILFLGRMVNPKGAQGSGQSGG
jgi:serpin B